MVVLNGIVKDDGQPAAPAAVTTRWSKVSGKGPVSFNDPSQPMTTARFSKAGTYQLRLTVDDGERIGWSDVKIKVKKPPRLV